MNQTKKRSRINNVTLVKLSAGNQSFKYKILINNKPLTYLFSDEELKNLKYWNKKKKWLSVRTEGTAETFAAQIAIGNFIFPKVSRKNWAGYYLFLQQKIKFI